MSPRCASGHRHANLRRRITDVGAESHVGRELPAQSEPLSADEILISCPLEDGMLDVARHFLTPADIKVKRRNSELPAPAGEAPLQDFIVKVRSGPH